VSPGPGGRVRGAPVRWVSTLARRPKPEVAGRPMLAPVGSRKLRARCLNRAFRPRWPLGVRRPIAPIVLSTHRWAVKTLDTTGPISVVTSMPPPFRWVRMASTSHGTRESNGASGGLEPGWTSIGERALPVITADDAETERRGSPTVDQRGAMAKAASRYAVLRSRRRIRRGVRREVEAPRLDARCL
jgi:hypothetical protein